MTISSGSGGLGNLHRTRSDPEAKVDCAIQSVGQASVGETMQTPENTVKVHNVAVSFSIVSWNRK